MRVLETEKKNVRAVGIGGIFSVSIPLTAIIYYLNTALSGGNITGVDDGYFDTASYVVMKGRGFSKNDYAKARRVALIDESVESSLFSGESALGKTVEIQGYPFTVVGVVTEKDSYDLVINSIDDYYMYAYDDSQGNVFVPSGTWRYIWLSMKP